MTVLLIALLFGAAAARAQHASASAATERTAVSARPAAARGPTPITVAKQETWEWVAFADAFCGNGSTTGIGVNFNDKSSRVFIYLEEGGACWSDAMCYVEQTAAHFTTGYGSGDFAADSSKTGLLGQSGGFFDRTAAGNPFKDDNYIFVPYCTGDLHAGDNTVEYDAKHTAKHVGYANITAYLQRIVASFPAATRVTIAGSSAGGYGALVNWDQTQRAFGTTRVDLIDDSGTPMPASVYPPTSPIYEETAAKWNLAGTLPAGCANCLSQGLTALFDYYASAYPGDHAAFLTYKVDSVLPWFFGLTNAQFQVALDDDLASTGANADQQYFVVNGGGHILFFDPQLTTDKVTLQTWLTEMTTDEPAWTTVKP